MLVKSFDDLLTSRRRVSRHRLKDDQFVSHNLRGLLERGVQKTMDPVEPRSTVDPSAPPLAIHWGQTPLY
jgi:hypothetical protein